MMNNPLLGCRVLVVEDEALVGWALVDMLDALGCTVVGPAARVNQAVAMLESETLDAALLDINLNGVKSYPVADALVARRVPFAFSSGYGNDMLSNDHQKIPLLRKPFGQLELGAMLMELLTPGKVGA